MGVVKTVTYIVINVTIKLYFFRLGRLFTHLIGCFSW